MTWQSGRAHAVYAASQSERWLHCTGSISYTAGLPEGTSSSYAEDGTEAHELLSYALTNGYRSAYTAHMALQPEWQYRHDTEEIRLESVQEGLDHIWDLIDAYGPGANVWLECQFQFPSMESDDVGGTTDVAIYVQDFDMMIIADYKHGSGVMVDVHDNSQLMMYAASVRHELRKQGLPLNGQTAYRLTIIQPRAFSHWGRIREWVVDDNKLDHFSGEVEIAIRKSRSPTPELIPGKYCRWCPAYSTCPAAEEKRIKSIPLPQFQSLDTLKNGLPEAKDIDLNRLAQILEAQAMIDEWFKAVYQHSLALAKQGINIPGFKLVEAQAKSKWHGEPRAVAVQLAHIVGYPDPNVFMPPKLVTITEAKQFIKEQIYERVGGKNQQSKKLVEEANKAMATLLTRESSGNMVLVPIDDKRPAILNPARIEFNSPGGAT